MCCVYAHRQVERYDKYGYDQYGYDRDGYDKYAYNRLGYHRDGTHKVTLGVAADVASWYSWQRWILLKQRPPRHSPVLATNVNLHAFAGVGSNVYGSPLHVPSPQISALSAPPCVAQDGYDHHGYDRFGYDREG